MEIEWRCSVSRTIEGRLAKLEARGGIGKGEVIFVQNRPDESKEDSTAGLKP